MSEKLSFFSELKRRNVYKVAVAYAVVAWLLIQAASILFPAFDAPASAIKILVIILVIGFPIALAFSWAFEITPEGIKREAAVSPNVSITHHTGRKIVVITVVLAVIAAGLLAFQLFRSKSNVSPRPNGMATTSSAASGPIPEKSVAVLPFENLSDDKQNAFFADGVQDEILTNLAKVADLKVISRTSVMQYRGAASRNLREIGQTLGVAHALEGSVQKIANKVRVNAQLIDARNDAHLWAQTYDRDLADVFAIQSEIAQAIAEQLQARLSTNEKAEIAKPPTTDPIAYGLYLRARQLDDMANDPDAKGSLLRGISLLEEAVRRDPKFLRAYCLMCETHLDLYWAGFDHTEQRRETARTVLQKAEELQPDAGEVHWMKGLYAYHGFRDYEGARKELEPAKRLLPNEARIYMLAGAVDRRSGHLPEAVANFQRAVELDPRNFIVLMEAASTFGGMRRYTDATSLYERALNVQSNDSFASFLLGFNVFARSGDVAGLRKPLDRVARQGGEAARSAAFPLLVCSWLERNKNEAEKAVALIPPEGVANSFDEAAVPREYCVGRTAWLFGDKADAKDALTAARTIFERTTIEQPDYAQAWSYLGLTDAMLGRRNDAIREGKRACEVLPFSKDSWIGAIWVTNLAMIYTLCGEKDAALEQLQISAKLPVGVSYGELKQSPDWDALRDDPRFQKLVASLAPK